MNRVQHVTPPRRILLKRDLQQLVLESIHDCAPRCAYEECMGKYATYYSPDGYGLNFCLNVDGAFKHPDMIKIIEV